MKKVLAVMLSMFLFFSVSFVSAHEIKPATANKVKPTTANEIKTANLFFSVSSMFVVGVATKQFSDNPNIILGLIAIVFGGLAVKSLHNAVYKDYDHLIKEHGYTRENFPLF